jgi:pentose-5-phosphate-3-epimerase
VSVCIYICVKTIKIPYIEILGTHCLTVTKEICHHLTVLNDLRKTHLYPSCTFLLSVTVHVEHVQGVDKIMETLRNCEIEFVLAILKELQLATLYVLRFVYTV